MSYITCCIWVVAAKCSTKSAWFRIDKMLLSVNVFKFAILKCWSPEHPYTNKYFMYRFSYHHILVGVAAVGFGYGFFSFHSKTSCELLKGRKVIGCCTATTPKVVERSKTRLHWTSYQLDYYISILAFSFHPFSSLRVCVWWCCFLGNGTWAFCGLKLYMM